MSVSELGTSIEQALAQLALARFAPSRVLLAVSGGPDSLALLLTVADWAQSVSTGPAIFVATVDHALRAESAAEARFVAEICGTLALPHRTLRWDRTAGSEAGNAQAAAREARYRLLADEARRVGAAAILTGHHRDDQIETHLMARTCGAALAGMRIWRDLEPGLMLLRPFLQQDKDDLRVVVEAAGLRAVDDPTNRDPHYARTRVREALRVGEMDRAGCIAAVQRATTERRATDEALAREIRRLADRSGVMATETGEILVDGVLKDATGALLLSRILTAAGGALYPPDHRAVARLADRLARDPSCRMTLGGCCVERRGEGGSIVREYGRTGLEHIEIDGPGDASVCFDRRFDIVLGKGRPERGGRIVAFGSLGRGNLRERTLPVLLDGQGTVLAAHPALQAKLPKALPLRATSRLGWRIWANLDGSVPAALTAEPQIAANPVKPVGKDLADTYLR